MFGSKGRAEERAQEDEEHEAAAASQLEEEQQLLNVKSNVLDLTREPPVQIITHHDGRVEHRRWDSY
jgi:hypothetical protein